MIDTLRGRVLVVVLLLVVHALLVPAYALQPMNAEAGVFPDATEFTETPERYLGDRVVTGGFVQQTSPVVIEVETTRGKRLLTVTDSELSPAEGDKLRVYGVLTGPETIQSLNAFVVPRGGLFYTWGISFLAGLWVLSRLLRHWTVDRSRLAFRRRDAPISIRALVRGVTSRGEEGNA